jgi:hypothetical protein
MSSSVISLLLNNSLTLSPRSTAQDYIKITVSFQLKPQLCIFAAQQFPGLVCGFFAFSPRLDQIPVITITKLPAHSASVGSPSQYGSMKRRYYNMSGLLRAIIKSTRSVAKGAGKGQSYFRRTHMAVLFEPAEQAAPVILAPIDMLSAWGSQTAHAAYAAPGLSGFALAARLTTSALYTKQQRRILLNRFQLNRDSYVSRIVPGSSIH